MIRMGSLHYGRNNSLVRLREQAEGIHETLKRAQEGMNVQKNRCDHFPDMLASEYPAQSYPNVREGGNSRLFIDYDSSLQLIRWLESLLENELNPKRVPQSQMGAWERMYECVESGLYHCRKNLEEENDGAVRDLKQQYHRLENFRDSLIQYHMELDQLEETADLTDMLDRISRLQEAEKKYLIQLFFSNCSEEPGAVDSFLIKN